MKKIFNSDDRNSFKINLVMDDENNIQYYWDLAIASQKISPQLSKSLIYEMLDSIKAADKPIPEYFKKLFCYKCFTIFEFGTNARITIRATKKHPNMKMIEYRCLNCQNIQRINAQRIKKLNEKEDTLPEDEIKTEKQTMEKKVQQKRKLFTSIFS